MLKLVKKLKKSNQNQILKYSEFHQSFDEKQINIQFKQLRMATVQDNVLRNMFIQLLQRDNSYTIYFLFTITLDMLAIMFNLETNMKIICIIICLLNGIIGIQQKLIPKQKFFYYKNLCLTISKLSTIVLILIIDREQSIVVLLAFEGLGFGETKQNQCQKIESLIVKFLALAALMIKFDPEITVVIVYSIILEINKQIFLTNQTKLIPKQQFQIFTQMDSQWSSRLQAMPSCYLVINPKTMKILYKNDFTFQYFHDLFQNEYELDEILLNKLQFKTVQEKIDQIKDFSKRKNCKEKQTCKLNRWQFKSDSVSLKVAPQNAREQSKQTESLDFLPSCGITLTEFIQNKFGEKSMISQNSIECVCDQARSTLASSNSQISHQNIQLFGQIIQNQADNEIIVVLNDVTKQAELQQLMQNDEFKSKMIESFSHELRTPLNSAQIFLTSALQEKAIPEDIKEKLIVPAIGSLKMQSYFISDIIDLSQINANKLQMKIEEFTLRELVNEISNIFKIQFELKKIDFQVDLLDSQATIIAADYSRLIQVLVNLLQNSLKFSENGLIVLKISSSLNNTLKFSVLDEGKGIETDHLYQLQILLKNIEQNKTIQINQTWQGFGLLVSAILVNKLAPKENKIIQITSEGLNCGTEVSFYLENHIMNFQNFRQNTLRQSSSRFQGSHESQQKVNVNGHIYQATEFHISLSKQLIVDNQFQNFQDFEKPDQINKKSDTTNDLQMLHDSQSFEAPYYKYGQLSPLSYSFITEKLMRSPKAKSPNHFESHQKAKRKSIKKITFAEMQEELDLLEQFRKQKKCTCNNLLSVDDEIFNQRSIQLLLSQLGFNVILAFNGEQALQKVIQMKPCSANCQLFTLILMDYQMPIMDGLASTRKLIEMMNQNLIPRIHIIGLTAFTSSQDIESCINAGMSDVLSKPLNLKSLNEILTRI